MNSPNSFPPNIISKFTKPTSKFKMITKSTPTTTSTRSTSTYLPMKPKNLNDSLDGVNHRSSPHRSKNSWQQQNSFAYLSQDDNTGNFTGDEFNDETSFKTDQLVDSPALESKTESTSKPSELQLILQAIQRLDNRTAKLDEKTDRNHASIQHLHSEFDSQLEETKI